MSEPRLVFQALHDLAFNSMGRCCDSLLHPPLSDERLEVLRRCANTVPEMIRTARPHQDFGTVIFPLIEKFRERFDDLRSYCQDAPQVIPKPVIVGGSETKLFNFDCEPLQKAAKAGGAFTTWLGIEINDYIDEIRWRVEIGLPETPEPLSGLEKRVREWLRVQCDNRNKREAVIKVGAQKLIVAMDAPPNTAVPVTDHFDSVTRMVTALERAIPEAAGWFISKRTSKEKSLTYNRGRKHVGQAAWENAGKCAR